MRGGIQHSRSRLLGLKVNKVRLEALFELLFVET